MSGPVYKHVEGTDYACPECFVTVAGETTRPVLQHLRRDVFLCPQCQSQFSAGFLEKISSVNPDNKYSGLGHMWAGTAHEETLVDAIEDYLQRTQK